MSEPSNIANAMRLRKECEYTFFKCIVLMKNNVSFSYSENQIRCCTIKLSASFRTIIECILF